MKSIRQRVFETNSSSVHSVTITDWDTHNKWKNNEALYSCEDEDLFSASELLQKLKEFVSEQVKYLESEKHFKDFTEANEKLLMQYVQYQQDLDSIDEAKFTDYIKNLAKSLDGYLTGSRWKNFKEKLTPEEYEKTWKSGESIIDVFFEYADSWYNENAFFNLLDMETFSQSKLIKGEEVIAFGYYGYDG